jgi:predicted NodU family carbamoyl transferase
LTPDNPKEAMYALGINLAHDASACLIGGNGANFSVREGAPPGEQDACVPDAAGRWFALVPVERVTACLDAAGIDYGDLDTVTFCNGVVWTATELRNLTVADCVLQLPWSMQSRLEAIGAHLAEAHGGWYVTEFSDTAILVVTPHGSITGWRRSGGGSAIPLIERATIYHATLDGLRMIGRIEDPAGSVDQLRTVVPPSSYGMTVPMVMPLARLAIERTGCRRLCIVGHVHDVASAITQVRGELDVELFVHAPARSAALGAALHGWYCALGQPPPRPPVLRSHEAGVC